MSPAFWLKLDVDFAENAKVTSVPIAARWFHLTALLWCARNLTDGHVSAKGVKVVGVICELPPNRHVQALVKARLWRHDAAGDGFWINDYLKHQQSREEAEARSEAAREAAQARWKARRNASGNAERIADGNADREIERKNSLRAVSGLGDEQPLVREIIDKHLGEAS